MMDLIYSNDKPKRNKDSTFFYTDSLPKIALPNLQESIQTFINWCSPLLNKEELEETIKACDEFEKGDGLKLQKELERYNSQDDVYSWLDNFWKTRYLKRRVPVSINANFFLTFKKPDISTTQIQKASELICAGVYYKQELDKEQIPVDKIKGNPLCMVQNKYLFSTTRIPHKICDSAKTPYSKDNPSFSKAKHIIVIHNHQIFSLEVISKENQAFNKKEIEQALEKLINSSPNKLKAEESIGYLTSLERTKYADVRDELLSEKYNAIQMKIIEDALFCVCLDNEIVGNEAMASDYLLCGDGGNRWFDKSLSLIVFKGGMAGVNIEHCGLDGTTAIGFIDFIHNETTIDIVNKKSMVETGTPSFEKINFNLSSSLEEAILQAKNSFETLASSIATKLVSFDEFGSNHIKSLGISPDAFCQISFALAHYKTKGFVGATYESISTRHYERGRTEAMRVVTPAIINFVKVMQEDKNSISIKKEALDEAVKQHLNRIRECQNAKAPEQHLWQLQFIAQEKSKELGVQKDFKLFHSAGWLKMRDDYLSTSSAPSQSASVFGFGATSKQCIGTGYITKPNKLKIYLSTPSDVSHYMDSFSDNLAIAFKEIALLLKNA